MKAAAEPLPQIMVVLFAVVSVVQSVPVTDQLGQTLQNSANDIGRLSESRAHHDSTYGAAIPSATRFAVHESSYELGRDNAGITWRWNNLQSVPDRATAQLDSTANQKLRQRELEPLGNCKTPSNLEPEASTQYPQQDSFQAIETEISVADASVSCEFENGDVEYSEQYTEKVYARNNRYLFMVEEARRYHQELRLRFSNRVGPRSATRSSCSSFSAAQSSASSAANNDIQRDVKDAFETSTADAPPSYYDFPDWITVRSRTIKSQGETLDTGGGNTGVYNTATENTQYIDRSAVCTDEVYDPAVARVTITPGGVQTRLRMEDKERGGGEGWRIPFKGEWKRPILDIAHYSQKLDQD